jgi:hypothetical protein
MSNIDRPRSQFYSSTQAFSVAPVSFSLPAFVVWASLEAVLASPPAEVCAAGYAPLAEAFLA